MANIVDKIIDFPNSKIYVVALSEDAGLGMFDLAIGGQKKNYIQKEWRKTSNMSYRCSLNQRKTDYT